MTRIADILGLAIILLIAWFPNASWDWLPWIG